MRRVSIFIGLIGLLALSACGRLDAIPYDPPQTPESWLQIQPFVSFHLGAREVVLVQPSTTAIVTLLGILTIAAGAYFLKIREGQRSRLWWGIALFFWGIGALLAGTSYEAFSYAIKCAGREACLWTSWWEIFYLIFSVWSIDAMLLAVAHACLMGRGRRGLSMYAYANAVVYLLVVLVGSFVPVRFLISFELLLIVAAPSILAMFGINVWRYSKEKDKLDLALTGAWLWLGLTIGAYFLYYISGWTESLWARGVWFSENDILHIGLILWMLYLALVVARRVKDAPER